MMDKTIGVEDHSDFPSLSKGARTIVLVGRTGNGKSATGNSILGRRAFKSRASSAGVTKTTELQSSVLKDGQIINVIDTPGLFDFSASSEFVGKEIVKCINLAKDGIDAILVVFSVRSRFSREEELALQSLQSLFGPKIVDYTIVVFTGGDELEDNDETLEDYLSRECPEPLQKILEACKNRCICFNNKTRDVKKKVEQLSQLHNLIDRVIEENGGRPYTDELFAEVQKEAMKLIHQEEDIKSLKGYTKQEISKLKDQLHRSYEEQLKRITETVETKLRETTVRLAEQVAGEKVARQKVEEMARATQQKSNDEIDNLRRNLDSANREIEKLRNESRNRGRRGGGGGGCTIM